MKPFLINTGHLKKLVLFTGQVWLYSIILKIHNLFQNIWEDITPSSIKTRHQTRCQFYINFIGEQMQAIFIDYYCLPTKCLEGNVFSHVCLPISVSVYENAPNLFKLVHFGIPGVP